MAKLDRLENLLHEWNDSAVDLLNPSSLSTKIYSEEDPLTQSGQIILGQGDKTGSADLVVPDDVVDVLKSQEQEKGIGKGFMSFLKTTFKELDVDEVSYNNEKQGGSYFDMVFPGNRVVSVSVWGEEGDQKLAVIYKLEEDEREIEVKDLKEGCFKDDGDVNADVFPADWLVAKVKEVLDGMDKEAEGGEDEEEGFDFDDAFNDEEPEQNEPETEPEPEPFGADKEEEERRNRPEESKYRLLRYGGMSILQEKKGE